MDVQGMFRGVQNSDNRRKTYESDGDRHRQTCFARDIESLRDVQLTGRSHGFRLDYFMSYRRKVIGFAEIKCRNAFSYTYPDIILSVSKAERFALLEKFFFGQTGKPLQNVLFIRFKDKDYYHRMKPLEHYTIDPAGGRTKNTRDSWDIEPVIRIPMTEMVLLQSRDCGDSWGTHQTRKMESNESGASKLQLYGAGGNGKDIL